MTLRDRFAAKLGVGEQRKADIYLDLSRSTTLTDPSYWLQTLFAAGIATLGLVLNSPAVIIGAMLISPLMGPILASGLALATGDVILGLRAALNLAISCLVAVGFAFLLVTVLPFKEITGEIAARMHPNTLDLAVALFSGAIGSIATCKEVKGVVTSIPGVAIAVALMPPLGVVGYGTAIAAGVNAEEGLRVALGGGLLFLTNLVAITFTAMLVFLALHIDAPAVKDDMEQWHKKDSESLRLRDMIAKVPGVHRIRHIGALPGRVIMVLVLIAIILIPLSRSFNQLKQELSNQKKENRIRKVVTQTWQKEFGKLPTGEARSYLDHVQVIDQDGKMTLQLRVLTTKPLTFSEKEQFTKDLTISLGTAREFLIAQIIEIPTASAGLRAKTADTQTHLPPSVTQLQRAFMERVSDALSSVRLPPPARLVDYQVVNRTPAGLDVILTYLGERDIEPDGESLIQQDVRARLESDDSIVTFNRLPMALGKISFHGSDTAIDRSSQQMLDDIARHLAEHPRLQLEILIGGGPNQKADTLSDRRIAALKEYLLSRWQIAGDRVNAKQANTNGNGWTLNLTMPE